MLRVKKCEEILDETLRVFNFRLEDAIDRKRHATILRARHVAVFIAYRAGYTLQEIGDTLERDHSSMSSAWRWVVRQCHQPNPRSGVTKDLVQQIAEEVLGRRVDISLAKEVR